MTDIRRQARWIAALVVGLAALSGLAPAARAAKAMETLQIKVLSNRADLISGGDALVEVVLPPGADPGAVRLDVDGRDVTAAFALRANGRFMGLVTGLKVGASVLSARGKGGSSAAITIINHPIGGPVFAGPQVQPWFCTTEANGLGPATDEACNAPTKYEFFYMPTGLVQSGFQPYDPANPPSDVALTTTDQGVTVPFIVRRETGTLDRSIYAIAVLFDPTEPWAPWAPQRAWNRKLLVPFGGSCSPDHRQGAPPDVLDNTGAAGQVQGTGHAGYALSRGFAVASTGLDILGQNCNEVVSAEALMMLKERLVESYGELRYTMAEGCSGGSIQQQNIASTYPGLLDGIMPQCSYPDATTTGNEVLDCSLLLHYWNEKSPELWAVAEQRAAVSGHETASTCVSWVNVYGFDQTANPSAADGAFVHCGVPPDQVYDAETNPDGVRCALQDYQVAIWGRRVLDGFAKSAWDNVGVQYGLTALHSGLILPEQFVDLNEKMGSYDIDFKLQPPRREADPGTTAIAYGAGRVTNGRELAKVPIIDLRGSSNNEIHTDFRSYALRERLVAANGHADNHVIFTAPTPLAVPASVADEAFGLMDRWLAAIEADRSADSLEVKVVRHKPAGAVDSCYIGEQKVTDQAICRAAFPYFGNPRIAAGGPLADDVMKCRLKPLDRADYDVVFTDDQWARLRNAFPDGVCDWNLPGVDQQPPMVWPTFADGPGGRPLGPAPVSISSGAK